MLSWTTGIQQILHIASKTNNYFASVRMKRGREGRGLRVFSYPVPQHLLQFQRPLTQNPILVPSSRVFDFSMTVDWTQVTKKRLGRRKFQLQNKDHCGHLTTPPPTKNLAFLLDFQFNRNSISPPPP